MEGEKGAEPQQVWTTSRRHCAAAVACMLCSWAATDGWTKNGRVDHIILWILHIILWILVLVWVQMVMQPQAYGQPQVMQPVAQMQMQPGRFHCIHEQGPRADSSVSVERNVFAPSGWLQA